MREIKFRVWDADTEQWITDNPMWHHRVMDDLKWSDVFPIPKWKTYQAIKFQQYTGLKDKNGKEIYEGDILKSGDVFNQESPYIVEYEHFLYWIQEADLREEYNFQQLEVVGNIFENPIN